MRRWRLVAARLALFALVLQLGLSFAHTHREDFFGVADGGGLYVSAPSQDRDSDGVEHDHCAICATVQILGTAFSGTAPRLTPPIRSAIVEHAVIAERPRASDPAAGFQARAPPLV
jgi:hypothetical protein